MNMSADNIIVSSCQYTPVYFIEDPGVSQARSYVLATNNQSVDKPACESLKRFYENSGKLESNLTLTDSTIKPRIIKKNDTNVVGNNLKLASFLLPKCEPKNELCKPVELAPVNSVVLKPVYIANNLSVNNVNSPNQTPKIDVNSRLVKLSKTKRNVVRSQTGKILPKIKPKENSPSSKQTPIAVQAVQPVQLIKFGETYHSLNQLSTDQMQMVNHALKMLNNTQSNPPESTCDPAANTKFIYKIVSQKDFAESKVVDKQVTAEIKKEPIEIEEPKIIDEEEPKVTFEAKVTRSGRVVKLPKNIILDNSPSKPKKRPVAIVACLQCSSKFSSPQRLHRHYENHPSHVPSNLHNNLFHCLVAMVSAGSEVERASILLQQLQLLMDRLQACMPCLLKNDHGLENINTISDEIGKLLGINPGKYNLNMEALSCVKDKDGYCSHNPRPQISISDNIKPHVILENIENGVSKGASNILKVNLQDRRPTILRKVECRKQKLERSSHNVNGKKIKLSQDIPVDKNSNSIEIDDLAALLNNTAKTDNKESKIMDKVVLNDRKEVTQDTLPEKVKKVTKPAQIQFHSAHFDIRSSPIKPTSTVFRKFQINPEKMTKYIEIIRPIQLNQLAQGVEMTNNTDKNINNINTQEIFSDTNVITSKETENLNCTSKNWCEDPHFMEQNNLINSHTDSFIKPNAAIEPALLHVKNGVRATNIVTNESVLKQVESDSVNKVTNIESLLDSQVQVNKITNQTSFIKPSILIEPLIPVQNDYGSATDKISNQIDNDDFMKSDILIDQPFLHTPDCKVINEITNRNHNFMKSNILTEPVLIHSRDVKIDKFADQANNFMTSDLYIDSALPHSDIDHGNRITDVTESSEIDVDLNSNQGQSIISFLESLGNELAYTDTETDSRNNIDFQLDLFSFNNSS